MIRVYVDMVADLFHPGHVNILRSARALGDELVVGIHSDEDATGYKRRPVMTMQERAEVVRACRYVDEVITDAPLVIPEEWVRRHRIDLVVHGDDFGAEEIERYYAVPQRLGIMRLMQYTAGVSTSQILDRIKRRDDS
jgi:glycerol-3-phosphate cytidylyltransferase